MATGGGSELDRRAADHQARGSRHEQRLDRGHREPQRHPAGEGYGAYCAAKAGVRMLAEVAALELGPRGVRVNTVAPGLVETSATAPFWTVPGLVDEFLDNTPLGLAAKPEDIAAAVRYLAGPESAHVSGAYLEVDGGAHTGRYPDLPAAFAAAVPTTPAQEKQ